MIDIKLIKKPRKNGVLSGGSAGGFGNNVISGVAKEALYAAHADFATAAEKSTEATRAEEASHAQEAAHAQAAFDLDEASPIRLLYLSRLVNDIAAGRIDFLQGLTTGSYAEGVSGGKFDGDGAIEAASILVRTFAKMVTAYAESVGSAGFIDGFDGEGFRFWRDIDTGESFGELDHLTVRRAMSVFELIIQKIRAVGGQFIVSAASGKIKDVELVGSGRLATYAVTFEDEAGFQTGDYMRCQTFTGGSLKSYWVKVASVDADGKVGVLASSFTDTVKPEPGDECVLLGSEDSGRQGAILIASTDDGSLKGKPRIDVLGGISGPTLTGCLRARLGYLDGISDAAFPADAQPQGYGLYSDNAYLKGRFVVSTKDASGNESLFEVTPGNILSEVKASAQDTDTEGSIGSVIKQTATDISATVTDGLKSTGIDIVSGEVTISADKTTFTDSDGVVQALFTDGTLNINAINANEVKAAEVEVASQDGRITIKPQDQGMQIFDSNDTNAELCQEFSGAQHPTGPAELFKAQPTSVSFTDTKSVSSFGLISGVKELAVSAMLSIEQPATLKFTGGKFHVGATANGKPTQVGIGGTATTYLASTCTAKGSLVVQRFSSETATVPLSETVVQTSTASASTPYTENAQSQPTDSDSQDIVLTGRKIRLTASGYYRLLLRLEYDNGNNTGTSLVPATNSGGVSLASGPAATYGQDEYISRYFGNGLCLGKSAKEYFTAFYNATDGLRVEARTQDHALRVSKDGIETLVYGDTWARLPRLLFNGLITWVDGQPQVTQGYPTDPDKWPNPTYQKTDTWNAITFYFPWTWRDNGVNNFGFHNIAVNFGEINGNGTMKFQGIRQGTNDSFIQFTNVTENVNFFLTIYKI